MAELRYSDKDLKEFEGLIHEKLASAREDLDQLQRSLSHRDDNSTEDTAPTFKMMEDGSETMSPRWARPSWTQASLLHLCMTTARNVTRTMLIPALG